MFQFLLTVVLFSPCDVLILALRKRKYHICNKYSLHSLKTTMLVSTKHQGQWTICECVNIFTVDAFTYSHIVHNAWICQEYVNWAFGEEPNSVKPFTRGPMRFFLFCFYKNVTFHFLVQMSAQGWCVWPSVIAFSYLFRKVQRCLYFKFSFFFIASWSRCLQRYFSWWSSRLLV